MNKGELIYLKMSNGDRVFLTINEIAEAGGSPLTRIHIDWYGGSSTSLLATSEVADEFLNLLISKYIITKIFGKIN